MKKQKVLSIEFHDEDGNVVKQLSKCPARPEDVMAAMSFLDVECDFVVSVRECTVDAEGKIIFNSEEV